MANGDETACLLWQHEHGRKWISYTDDEVETINKALNKKEKTVTLPGAIDSEQIVINFEDMVQKNTISGREQRIRCCLFDDDSFYVWQWKDDGNFWYCFIPGVALELEKCYKQGKEKLNFYFKNAGYEVNLKELTQTNEKTGTSRSIKRAKVALTKAEKALLKVAIESQATTVAGKNDSGNTNANGGGDDADADESGSRYMRKVFI